MSGHDQYSRKSDHFPKHVSLEAGAGDDLYR